MRHILLITTLLAAIQVGGPQAPATASIEGIVVDAATNRPIGGVQLAILGVFRTQTDANGRFSWSGFPPGRISLSFTKTGYPTLTTTYSVTEAGLKNVVIALKSAPAISGRVVDAGGRPIVDIRVQPFRYTTSAGALALETGQGTMTDDRGVYRLYSLPPGEYVLNYSRSPNVSRVVIDPLNGPPNPDLQQPAMGAVLYPGVTDLSQATVLRLGTGDIQLNDLVLGERRFGTLQVRLVNASSVPIKDLLVGFENFTARGPTDSSLLAEARANPNAPRPVAVRRPGPMTGNDQVAPGSDLLKTYWPNAPGRYRARANWTGADGSPASASAIFEYTGVEMTGDVVLTDPDGRVTCNTYIEESANAVAAPLVGNIVAIRLSDTSYGCSNNTRPADRPVFAGPLAAGKYHLVQFGTLPSDAYIVSARQSGVDALREGIQVSKDSPDVDILVRRAAGAIRGRVVDRDGKSAQNALIVAVPELPWSEVKIEGVYGTGRSDQSGNYELRGLIPTGYRIHVWPDGANAAYFDDGFMKDHESRGKRIRLEERDELVVNLSLP